MRIELLSKSRIEPALPSPSAARMPQHDPSWLPVLRQSGETADAILAIDEDEVVGWLPFVSKRSEIGTVLSSMPYVAYGGAVARNDDPAITSLLFSAYRDLAERENAVVAAVGTPPFLDGNVERVWREQFAPTWITENFLQVSALEKHPLEELPSHRRNVIRRHVRIATEAGCRVVRESSLAGFEAWRAIYVQRYEELGAVPYPEMLHRAIFEQLVPAGKAELWLVAIEDEIVGGTLFLVDDRTVDYFASVFASAHRASYPQDFLLDAAFREFVGRGLQAFNWESSPRKGGVSDFKAGWGAHESKHFYYSLVLDRSILTRSAAEIQQAFPLRFVVPFSELGAR